MYSDVELFRGKHQKTQYCNLFLLLLVDNYFCFKILKNLVQLDFLITEEEALVAFLVFE